MKKKLALLAVSMLLATPVLADTQPAAAQPAAAQPAAAQPAAAQPATAQPVSAQPADTTGGFNLNMKGITVNLGGFIEAAGIYRTRNLNSDMSSKFQSLPLSSQTGYYQDETRFSARQSRLSLLVKGDYNPAIHLAGYYEMDFLGAANSANSKESNSYNPRVRHLYTTIDWDNLGLHLLGGQTWSLVTMNNKGITPRNELTPLTIEAQYVPGFSWTRQPQFRITKDWDKTFWLALSVENPQSVSSSNANNFALGLAGGGNLDGVTVSDNSYPDVVVKASYDPSWGHFEVYDLTRIFKSTTISNGTAHDDKIATNAVGGGFIVPIVTNQLKLQGSALYGRGIGRYGSGQLPDVTVDPVGNIVPITALQLLAGLTYEPTSDWTFYGYYGLEEAQHKDMGANTTAYGYGNSLNNTAVGAPAGPGLPASFRGQLQRIDQATVGTWWKFFQGRYGKMQTGLQYSYTENKYFSGTAGAPKTADQMVFASLRYYWQ